MKRADVVNHPKHYKSAGRIEAIDVIEAFGLGFHLGNVVKYVLRAGRKSRAREIEDLAKARWYLDRKIQQASSRLPAAGRGLPSRPAASGRSRAKRGARS